MDASLPTQFLSEPSLGLYRIQEHVTTKVPQLVAVKKEVREVERLVVMANSDLHEAQEIVRSLDRVTEFTKIAESLKALKSRLQEKRAGGQN
ncbi:hypothetical protein BJ742DRAFT_827967 [Cladochytrium replicatum]|nr:hypothetical protein BJ742DRAFT_827967 [Cladochytrium replicatum]